LATGPEAPPPFTGSEERAVFEDVLLYNVADGDPERYVNEFGTLAAWSDSSLDMYKVWLYSSNRGDILRDHYLRPACSVTSPVSIRRMESASR